jgi:hypothetical protein
METGAPSTPRLSEHERQLTLAEIHIASMIRQGRSQMKIPDVINQLSCGCSRERGWEGESGIWQMVRREQNILHRECGRVLHRVE